eukprot:g1644.t1
MVWGARGRRAWSNTTDVEEHPMDRSWRQADDDPSDDGASGPTTSGIRVDIIGEQMPGVGFVSGRLLTISSPAGRVSVLPPLGGCGNGTTRVQDTARAAGCSAAINGGFWDTATGDCLGNVVSRGRLIQRSASHNANFGFRNGSIVTGYLSPEDVAADNATGTPTAFDELVAGVIWLVRDGRSYVQQSTYVEDLGTQETGPRFADVMSARTAIGHDRQGRIMLLHVDGKTWSSRGIDLYHMADLLVKLGAVNAVNLDGGGSSSMVINGTLVSLPSDTCPYSDMMRCEREVTTAICVVERVCEPGEYRPPLATACADCTPGRFSAVDGARECTSCAPGRFSAQAQLAPRSWEKDRKEEAEAVKVQQQGLELVVALDGNGFGGELGGDRRDDLDSLEDPMTGEETGEDDDVDRLGGLMRERLRRSGGGSESVAETLTREFADYDIRKDGDLDKAEFEQGLRKLLRQEVADGRVTAQDVDALMRRFDTDGDDKVSFDEFASYLSYTQREMRSIMHTIRSGLRDLSHEPTFTKLFAQFASRKGARGQDSIDFQEFRSLCTDTLKISLTIGEMKVLFDHIDSDDSNSITQDEFTEFLKADLGDIFRASEFDDHFPVVDIAVSTSDTEDTALLAKGFRRLHGNVNDNTWFGNKIHVWYKKGHAQDFPSDAAFQKACITDVCVAFVNNSKALVADGFVCLPRSLTKGSVFGKNIYIWYRRNISDSAPVLNLAVTVGNAKDQKDPVHFPPYHGYKRVQSVDAKGSLADADLNMGTRGSNVFLWTRKKEHVDPDRASVSLGKHGAEADGHIRERVKKIIREHATVNHGMVNLAQYAKSYTGKDDRIRPENFFKMLEKTGVHLTRKDARVLLKHIDKNSDGAIDLQEFFDFVEYDDAEMNAVLDKLRLQIQTAESLGQPIEDIFREEYDVEDRGKIDKRQFQKAMARNDVHLTSRELKTVMDQFSSTGDDCIDLDEFIAFAHDRTAPAAGGGTGGDRRRLNNTRSSGGRSSGGRGRTPGSRAANDRFASSSSSSSSSAGGSGTKPVPAAEAAEAVQDLILELGEVTDDGGDGGKGGGKGGGGTTFSWDAAWEAFAGDADRITVKELEKEIKSLGKSEGIKCLVDIHDEDLLAVLNHFDANADGYVDFDEFCNAAEDPLQLDSTHSHFRQHQDYLKKTKTKRGGGRKQGGARTSGGGRRTNAGGSGFFGSSSGGGREGSRGRSGGGRKSGRNYDDSYDDDDDYDDDNGDDYMDDEDGFSDGYDSYKGRKSRSRARPGESRRGGAKRSRSYPGDRRGGRNDDTMAAICAAIRRKAENPAYDGAGGRVPRYDWQRAWDIFDADKDGFLSFSEFSDAVRVLGVSSHALSKKELRALMDSFDLNGDRLVDFDEFKEAAKDVIKDTRGRGGGGSGGRRSRTRGRGRRGDGFDSDVGSSEYDTSDESGVYDDDDAGSDWDSEWDEPSSGGGDDALISEAREAFDDLKHHNPRGFSLEKVLRTRPGGAEGIISTTEFMRALRKSNFPMRDGTLRQLVRQLEDSTSRLRGADSRGRRGGRVDFMVFLRLMRSRSSGKYSRGGRGRSGKGGRGRRSRSQRHRGRRGGRRGRRGGGDDDDETDEDEVDQVDPGELKIKLRHMVSTAAERGLDLRQTFDLFDRNGNGTIDRHDFIGAAGLLGCTVTRAEAKALIKGLDGGADGTSKDGTVDFYEFCEFCEHPETKKEVAIDKVEEHVRALLREEATRRSKSGMEKLDVKSVFQRFAEKDRDGGGRRGGGGGGDGTISKRTFHRALREILGAKDLTIAEVKALVKRFDKDGDGRIGFEEFVSMLTLTPLSIDELAQRLRSRLLDMQRKTGRSHWETFRLLDKNGNGKLSRDEFQRALGDIGLALQSREVSRLLDRFDVDKDGQVDYRDFCRFASPTAANLSDEERIMRQRVREAAFARGGLAERFDDRDLRRAFHLDAVAGGGGADGTGVALASILTGVPMAANFDRFGIMTPAAFQQALDFLGATLGATELASLVSRFDPNGDGTVDYREFAAFADFSAAEIRSLADRLMKRAAELKKEGGLTLEDRFRELDDRVVTSGGAYRAVRIVERGNFEAVMRSTGMPVSEVELHALVDRFALPDDDQVVVYGDFCEFARRGTKGVDVLEATHHGMGVRPASASSSSSSSMSTSFALETKSPGGTTMAGADHDGLLVYQGAPRTLSRGFQPFATFMRLSGQLLVGGKGLAAAIDAAGSVGMPPPLLDAGSRLPQPQVSDWLENEATSRQRNMYRDLMRSFEVYAEEKHGLNHSVTGLRGLDRTIDRGGDRGASTGNGRFMGGSAPCARDASDS